MLCSFQLSQLAQGRQGSTSLGNTGRLWRSVARDAQQLHLTTMTTKNNIPMINHRSESNRLRLMFPGPDARWYLTAGGAPWWSQETLLCYGEFLGLCVAHRRRNIVGETCKTFLPLRCYSSYFLLEARKFCKTAQLPGPEPPSVPGQA